LYSYLTQKSEELGKFFVSTRKNNIGTFRACK
jgi:hypothetical protein